MGSQPKEQKEASLIANEMERGGGKKNFHFAFNGTLSVVVVATE